MKHHHSRRRGIALVITLLVIVVLTIAVTAFMQSMVLERRTSQAYLNILRAEEAAQSGLDDFKVKLSSLKEGPKAAVYLPGTLAGGSTDPDGPYLYLAYGENFPVPPASPTSRAIKGIPLFSTGATSPALLGPSPVTPLSTMLTVQDLDSAGSTIIRNLSSTATIITNINNTGVTGLKGANAAFSNLSVNWTYVRDNTGKVVSRYAYWSEDESSKIDLISAGNIAGSGSTHKRDQGEALDEISLLALGKVSAAFNAVKLGKIINFRTSDPVLNKLGVSQFRFAEQNTSDPGHISDSLWSELQPYVAIETYHDNRAPDGNRKLNLNELALMPDRLRALKNMRKQVEDSLPDFGLRAYRYDNHTSPGENYTLTLPAPSTPTAQVKTDYLTKLCVNILDYIDADNLPTVILGRGASESLMTTKPDPTLGGTLSYTPSSFNPANLPVVIGKENGAYISEYALVIRPINPLNDTATDQSMPVNLTFRMSHYIELKNYSGKVLSVANGDFGQNAFINISNRPIWSATVSAPAPHSTPAPVRPIDIELRLPSNFSIPARGFAVLVTEQSPLPVQAPPINASASIYFLKKGSGAGTWSDVSDPGDKTSTEAGSEFEDYRIATFRTPLASGRRTWRFGLGSQSYAATEQRMIFGNSSTLLDMLPTLISSQNANIPRDTITSPAMFPTRPFHNSIQSARNQPGTFPNLGPRFNKGDLRSNWEVKVNDDTAKKHPQFSSVSPFNNFSFAQFGNEKTESNPTSLDWKQAFPEYTTEPKGNSVITNEPMLSLGQLGHISDPASVDSTYRSGFRTLRIGQSDDKKNNRQFAVFDTADPTGSNNTLNDQIWTGGLGSNDPFSLEYNRNAFLLLDVFRTDEITKGRINPNGILRGAKSPVVHSITDGFIFNDATLAGFASKVGSNLVSKKTLAIDSTDRTNLEIKLREQLTAQRPILSVGELSRLDIFSVKSIDEDDRLADNLDGMFGASDSGREEFIRRSANLLTVNPLSFTVYLIGQSGSFTNSATPTFRVVSTQKIRAIVSYLPNYPASNPGDLVKPVNWSFKTTVQQSP